MRPHLFVITDREHFVETLLEQRLLVECGSVFTVRNTLCQEILEQPIELAGIV